MLVVFDSMTGNVQRFVNRLDMNNVKIHKELTVNEPFVLITYTTKLGEIPKKTSDFLLINHLFLVGVSSSGNMVWGKNYALAANKISEQYKVPIVSKFELSGTEIDIEVFIREVKLIVERSKMDSIQ